MKKILPIPGVLGLCMLLTGCDKSGGAGAWPVVLILLALVLFAMAALRTYSLFVYNQRAQRRIAKGRRARLRKMDMLTKLLYGAGGLLLILALCKPKLRRILIVTGILGGIAAIAIIIPLLPWLRQFQPLIRYVMTIEQLLQGQDISSGRMELYALALNAFRENPLFGIGWDQFHTLIPPEFLALHGQDVEDVHCIYLQFLPETGIVGAPFLIAPLLYTYSLICRQFHRLKTAEGMTLPRILCISSFMIQSFLLFLGIFIV